MRRIACAAVGLIIGMPLAAYQLAPAPATAAEGAPGSALGGYNTNAVATAVRLELLAPGIVPLGDSARGNFIQLSIPYAASNTTTGPGSTGTASPVWPGEVVATVGSTIGTFVPQVPAAVAGLLTYPAASYSSYPERSTAPGSSSYSPPAAGALGIATASTSSTAPLTQSKAAVSDLSPLGDGTASATGKGPKAGTASTAGADALAAALKVLLAPKLAGTKYAKALQSAPLIEITSASASTTGTTKAGSVSAAGSSRVGRLSVLGVIDIDGIASDAQASSDGTLGKQTSSLKVGSVSVMGQGAAITPEGIVLNGSPSALPNPAVAANGLLLALKQAGLSIRLIQPVTAIDGAKALVTSAAIQISFFDENLPNLRALIPQLPLPLPSALGLDMLVGGTSATAAATAIPSGNGGGAGTGGDFTSGGDFGDTGGGLAPDGGLGPDLGGSLGPQVGPGGSSGSNEDPFVGASAASLMGVPVRTAWVVLAFVFSLMGAGGLLAYANWQLLRGRTS